ncbi:unnamed protein product [Victoria cruziana]
MLWKTAHDWRTLQGSTYWKNLLDPLDVGLRRSIIHYGELAQATYDAFISQRVSRFAGDSRFAKEDLLAKVGLPKQASMYEVTKYVYGTSSILLPSSLLIKPLSREAWNKESNWIGYVAVATDAGKADLGRRDIVVAWRGTEDLLEWMTDFQFNLESATKLLRPLLHDDHQAVNIHQGWLSIYTSDDPRSHYNKTSARDQVLSEVKRLVDLYKDEEISITVTGHSLGAALATLNALDIVSSAANRPSQDMDKHIPVTAIVFASPRVGDDTFRQVFEKTEDLRLLRVRNEPDIVPTYPLIGYEDVGIELTMDTRKSSYLKSPGDFSSWHSLEAYLHGVAGTQGKSNKFKLEVDRDIALINKYLDGLKDEHLIPASWRVEKNKGMVQGPDGRWALMDHEHEKRSMADI